MQAKKTHRQQMLIIEKREKTAKAGRDYDANADLKKTAAARRGLGPGQGHKKGPISMEITAWSEDGTRKANTGRVAA